jgi:hypothetical protein
MELLFEEEAYTILGACFEVEKDKGCGFLEAGQSHQNRLTK